MRRDLRRSIQKSLGRYLAIVAIIALGAGVLCGLRCTTSAMLKTGQDYMNRQNLFDLRVLNTYGFTGEAVDRLAREPGVACAEGGISIDALLRYDQEEEPQVYRLMQIPQQVNLPELQTGRMPQRAGECLADSRFYNNDALGKSFTLASDSDGLAETQWTVVGLARSPVFMNFERGNTDLGKGTLYTFLYVPDSAFQTDGVYTEINLKLDETAPIYSDELQEILDDYAARLEPVTQEAAQARFADVQRQARQEIAKGKQEYQDGLATYLSEKKDADAKLQEGKQQLDSAWAEYDENEKTVTDGLAALESGRQQIQSGRQQILDGKIALQEQKVQAYADFAEAQATLTQQESMAKDGIAQLEDGLRQIEAGLEQTASGLEQLGLAQTVAQASLDVTKALLEAVNRSLETDPENDALLERKAQLETRKAELEAQLSELSTQQENLQQMQSQLETQKSELEAQLSTARQGLSQIEDGQAQLASSRIQAEDQFAGAQAKLEASALQLDANEAELEEKSQQLAQAQSQLEEGKRELDKAQAEYDEEKQKAESALRTAQTELQQAKEDLDQAEADLQDMRQPDVFVLDRNTNVGYVCFENDSGIVEGVGRVFPLLFFLVAALVCITTMTKMVDDERTQIGTLKALGYSGAAIMVKYLAYSGSASIIGCVAGSILGSVIFPKAIWQTYTIMYNISDTVLLDIDWPMCTLICVGFTACMLAVTWLCCRKNLQEMPAKLIRPKSPAAGKHLLLERLPFWHKIGFLRKVSIRNAFRYHKRLVMMLIGIGGCTALLVTGFGIRDSITNLVRNQYEQVTVYDMAVTFTQGLTDSQQESFLEHCAGDAILLSQKTMDAESGGSKSVTVIAARQLDGYMDLHSGSHPVSFPGQGQAVVSKSLARALNLSVGSTLRLRNSDLEHLEVTVSGIFDNNVYHYVIVSLETLESGFGPAEINTAYVNVPGDADVYEFAAGIGEMKQVMTVLVSEDMKNRVGNMLDSLDYIVALVVGCAAALAFIVLYNLTNINISERLREIATIKVLGFYPWESASYVFREGMLLTILGCAVGLAAGNLLNRYVMSQIRIDMVFFDARVAPVSYLWSIALTFLFAVCVDAFLYRKLERINMAEALKSVE